MDPKPKKIEVYTCHICGAVFTEAGPAKNCIRCHLDSRDLRIHHAVITIPGTEKFSHSEGDPYPAIIEVYSDKSERRATYMRIDSIASAATKVRRSAKAPLWSR